MKGAMSQASVRARLAAIGLCFLTANINAESLNDWVLDLAAVPGAPAGAGKVTGIVGLEFDGLFHSVANTTSAVGLPSFGDTVDIDLLLGVTAFLAEVSSPGSGAGYGSFLHDASGTQELNRTFEVTGRVTTSHTLLAMNPSIGCTVVFGCFSNDAGGLDIYIDFSPNGNTHFDGTGGVGLDDGALIATFELIPQDLGGVINLAGESPSSAMFYLAANPFGALQDAAFRPLAVNETLAFTNSTMNVDPDGNGLPDTQVSIASPIGPCGIGSPLDSCSREFGSFALGGTLAPVPLPSAVVLLVSAAVCFGFTTRFQR